MAPFGAPVLPEVNRIDASALRSGGAGGVFQPENPGDAIVAVPIWTTTPWTLPASLAVTLGKELDYVLADGPPPSTSKTLKE